MNRNLDPLLYFERSSKEYVILLLSFFGSLGVLPFIIHRYMTMDWAIAAVDTISFITMITMFFYVYKTRETEAASWILAVMFVMTEVMSVALKGTSQIVWSFPATVGIYYLIQIRKAILINTTALAVIYSLIHKDMANTERAAFLIAMTATNIFTIVFAVRNNIQQQKLEDLTLKDPLTGVNNRRAFDTFLDAFEPIHKEPPQYNSMIMVDIDHFKSINDQYGHIAGDQVLIKLIALIQTQLHHDEKLYRIGGEEFVIVPMLMEQKASYDFADRLRKIVENSILNEEMGITISIGVAQHKKGEDVKAWLKRADDALYKAKNLGRNQTAAAESLE